jgi:transcriptional regulator with GAF, ATPase, and Fis domain
VRLLIRQVARTQATVLIQGESGTGKELVARALHQESPRASAPLIKVNCAAIPDNLIESEFFGHEKGAFTGALTKREGRFELAHGGTILLDEISEIAPSVQAKLLRVLQEREFERVGGARTIKVDVRVIATTNRHLEQAVQRREFREDLFFRINVVPIQVPPLRDRREDIPHLAEHFLRWFARKHGCAAQRLSDSCAGILSGHPWPGNVRELQNVIERAVILAGDSPVIEPAQLCLGAFSALPAPAPVPAPAPESPALAPASACPPAQAPPAEDANHFPPLHELEKRHIYAALERCNHNRTQAARALGISVRTLRNKLNEYAGQPADPAADAEEPDERPGAAGALTGASPKLNG